MPPIYEQLFQRDRQLSSMAPRANRHSDEEWLSRKTEIRELFMEKGLKFAAVLQQLESRGFPVR